MENKLEVFKMMGGKLRNAEKSIAIMSVQSIPGLSVKFLKSYNRKLKKETLGGIVRNSEGEITGVRLSFTRGQVFFEAQLLVPQEEIGTINTEKELKEFVSICMKFGSLGCTAKREQTEDGTEIINEYVYLLAPQEDENSFEAAPQEQEQEQEQTTEIA
jgi:hypothetical protein